DLERRLSDQPILPRLLRHAPARPQPPGERRKGLHAAEPDRHESEFDRGSIAVSASDDQSSVLIDMTWNDQLAAAHLNLARIRDEIGDVDMIPRPSGAAVAAVEHMAIQKHHTAVAVEPWMLIADRADRRPIAQRREREIDDVLHRHVAKDDPHSSGHFDELVT